MTELPGPTPPPPPAYSGGLAPYRAAPEAPSAELDAVSIAALVTAATCCGGPVAVVLGVIGLTRTRQGRRKGRWAAVTGLVLGVIGSLVLVPVVAGIAWLAADWVDDLDPAVAHPGQCFTMDEFDWPDETACSGPHEGEIVWVGLVTADLAEQWRDTRLVEDFCLDRPMSPEHAGAYEKDESLRLDYWTDGWDREPSQGEWLICYLTNGERSLDGSLSARPA